MGIKFFYKRDGKEKWLGPGKVVFQDGKVVFVRHGGVFVRVSPNRLCKENGVKLGDMKCYERIANEKLRHTSEIGLNDNGVQENKQSPSITEYVPNVNKEDEKNLEQTKYNDNQLVSSLKEKDTIQYKLPNSDDWIKAKVIGRAGKMTGANRNWLNVHEEVSNENKSVDLGKLEWKKVIIDDEEDINMINEITVEKQIDAKHIELDKLRNFNTYQEVKDSGQHALSTRWVVTNKDKQVKARLVARGFEEEYLMSSDSPTIGKGAIRMFLSICSSHNWIVKTTDIKSAFLQGKELKRDIYLKPPKESNTPNGIIWKLNHCLYGLKDGARQFYLSVKEELIKLGCKQANLDPALFYMHTDGKLNGFICCHVDDFLHAGNEQFDAIMDKFRLRFCAGKIEERNFKYIGFQLIQDSSGIILDHSNYMETLTTEVIDPTRALNKQDILGPDEQTMYRKLLGQLNWAVQGSRPDMAFEMIDLSTKLKEANIGDLLRAIKAVNRLKDIKSIILFPNLHQEFKNWEIIVFTDASLANICCGKGSIGAHIVWLKNDEGRCCPLAWQANKIKRVVRSTIAAEALSLQEGLESGFIIEDF